MDYLVEVPAAIMAEGAYTRRAVEVAPHLTVFGSSFDSVFGVNFGVSSFTSGGGIGLRGANGFASLYICAAGYYCGGGSPILCPAGAMCPLRSTSNLAYLVITPPLAPQFALSVLLGPLPLQLAPPPASNALAATTALLAPHRGLFTIAAGAITALTALALQHPAPTKFLPLGDGAPCKSKALHSSWKPRVASTSASGTLRRVWPRHQAMACSANVRHFIPVFIHKLFSFTQTRAHTHFTNLVRRAS